MITHFELGERVYGRKIIAYPVPPIYRFDLPGVLPLAHGSTYDRQYHPRLGLLALRPGPEKHSHPFLCYEIAMFEDKAEAMVRYVRMYMLRGESKKWWE